MLNERKLTKTEEKRKEELVKRFKKDKRDWVARYGKDAEAAMYGTAVKNAKRQVEEMNQNKIKEAVKKALMKENPVAEYEYMEPEDYEDLMALQDATAMMDAIEDLYKKAKALGYGPDVKKLVADLDEELKGGQKKLDADGDGEISGKDFQILRAKKKKLKEEDWGSSDYSDYSNDALTDMIVNLSRYEGTEDLVKRVKDELENRRKKSKSEMKEGYYGTTNIEIYIQTLGYDSFEDFFNDNPGAENALMDWIESVPEFNKILGDADLNEDLDLGHKDDEPHMIKGELYRIGKYAMELYQMVDEFEGMGEVDFPAWWQAMITDSASKMVKAKHYLDFETKEPQIDAMVGAIDMSGALNNVGVDEGEITKVDKLAAAVQKALNAGKISKDEAETFRKMLNKGDLKGVEMADLEEGLPKGFWAKKIPGGKVDESFDALVKKLKGQGKSEKAAKAIAGAVASYKAKGGGKGPTAKQKK